MPYADPAKQLACRIRQEARTGRPNPIAVAKNEREANRDRRNKVCATKRAYVLMYKQTHPCVDCGESDPVVLDFDHREPHLKRNNVSHLTASDGNLGHLVDEINLCDVRCSNCHRRKHHRERVAAL